MCEVTLISERRLVELVLWTLWSWVLALWLAMITWVFGVEFVVEVVAEVR